MKFLYIGVFEKPYDTEVYIAKTLRSLGHEVIEKNTNRVTLDELKEIAPKVDVILFSKGWFKDKNEEYFTYLKNCGTTTVGWFWDLAWNSTREWQIHAHPAFRSELVFTTDGGHDKEFKELGINHRVLRQGIYEPEAYMATQDEQNEEIVFVGTSSHAQFGWSFRSKLLGWLDDTYQGNYKWYGKGDGVRNKALNQLYANTKIVVGDTVCSPNYWSNRIYETLGRGGFLIFPMVKGLDKEFKPYKHFVPYNVGDWSGLKEKIDYYLSHDRERETIRRNGFEYCKYHHTYTKRCEELVRQIYEYKKSKS